MEIFLLNLAWLMNLRYAHKNFNNVLKDFLVLKFV